MNFALKLQTAPAVEPVTLTEAKQRLRVTIDDEDTDIEAMIREARAVVEGESGRALVTQTWSLYLDDFPACGNEIRLPRPPLQSVTWVKYYDTDGNQQTLSSSAYHVSTGSEPGRICLASGNYWPAVQDGRPEAVEVRFVCGYATVAAIPEEAKAAVRVVLSDRHENPGGGTAIPPAARRLIDQLEYGECR